MGQNLRKTKGLIGAVTTLMTFDAYLRSTSMNKYSKILDESKANIQNKLSKLEQMESKLQSSEDQMSVVKAKLLAMQDRVETEVNVLTSNQSQIKDYSSNMEKYQSAIDMLRADSTKRLETIGKEFQEFNTNLSSKIDEILNSGSDKNEFISDLIGNFQMYLDTLNTVQQGALACIFFAITVYYCAIAIAITYYGDKLIIYLNLEKKYPKLAR